MKRISTLLLLACLTGCATTEQHPASSRLALVEITGSRFGLMYDGKTDLPIGTNVHGFVVSKLTPKSIKKTLPDGQEIMVDVSEITLTRAEETITLVKGRRKLSVDLIAHLIDQSNQNRYEVRVGDEFVIGSRRLCLLDINVKKRSCTLQDVNSEEQFTITPMSQQKNGR